MNTLWFFYLAALVVIACSQSLPRQLVAKKGPKTLVIDDRTVNATVENTRDNVVFIKLHKVGSTSSRELLLQVFDNYDRWWNCPASDPYSHSIMTTYAAVGKEEILLRCLKPTARRPDFMIQLREPVERFGSMVLFNLGSYHMACRRSSADSDTRQNIFNILEKFQKDLKNITVAELRYLFSFLTEINAQSISQSRAAVPVNRPIFVFHTYQMLLGNRANEVYSGLESDEMVQRARETLRSDFDVVGLTEHMPSHFVVMSLRYNISLRSTCDKYITRNTVPRNMRIFGKHERPATRDTYSKEVVDFLENEFFVGEQKIYEEAVRMHEYLLTTHGHTIESATKLWENTCAEFIDVRRQYSKLDGVMQ